MNSQETDKEARATKNTKNVWKWILGIGVVLMLIAFWGGFFNHDENFQKSDNPSGAVSDSTDSDTNSRMRTDTMMESVRGTK